MKSLYIKEPIVTPYNFEHTLIQAKEYVRSIVNHWQEQKLTLLGSSALKVYIEEKVANSKILLLEETGALQEIFNEETYLRVMHYPELEEMVRIEGEYWVIRKKLPVSTTKTPDNYFKVILGHKADHARFDTFRAAEKWLQETYIPVERINQSISPFREEKDLVALFKVK